MVVLAIAVSDDVRTSRSKMTSMMSLDSISVGPDMTGLTETVYYTKLSAT